MKSIALTLAVLFGLVSVAQAATETPATTDQQTDGVTDTSGKATEGSADSSNQPEETEQTNN